MGPRDLQVLRQQIHQDDQASVAKLAAQQIQLLPAIEPHVHQIHQLRRVRLAARRHLRDVRFQLRLEEHLHLGSHARLIGEFTLEDVVDAEHKVEPADASFADLAFALIDVMDEVFKGIFAAGGGVAGVAIGADELYDVDVIEEESGVAGRIVLERCGHEVGEGEG